MKNYLNSVLRSDWSKHKTKYVCELDYGKIQLLANYLSQSRNFQIFVFADKWKILVEIYIHLDEQSFLKQIKTLTKFQNFK